MLDTVTAPAPSFRSLKERISRRDILFPTRVEEVARLCLDHPELLAFGPTSDIARRAGVSSSTVLRFVAVMGFSNIKAACKVFQDEIRRRSQVYG
ncbi:RpiR family transcriptional regulator [Rhizobium lusitanum]|uniref:RpiR family transcriptional regulator n=1 Tax=Rhizobium lusitanum TaxID=293958 RepID=UPI00195AEEF2|nr:RpiR family transcriptional regulator [Rhizobium lusitanum]MBM7046188.1 RpiR family transcriptional regulator [Rhizobium lusitanum]